MFYHQVRSRVAAKATGRAGRQKRARAPRRGQMECLEDRVLMSVAPEEQLFVYLLNRARHDPVAYQREQRLPLDLSYVVPRAPLAINDKLMTSSEFHAVEMATYDYVAHQSAVTGDWPNKMARDQGYLLPSWWSSGANNIESVLAGVWEDTAQEALNPLLVDTGVNPPGHRDHLLGVGDFHGENREIGVGKAYNLAAYYDNYWAIHATRSDAADRFLTGVVFQDANSNGRYDRNEGLSGVTISTGSLSTTTNVQGGWSLKVDDGSCDVTAAGGPFVGTASVPVTVDGASVEVDFVSGLKTGYVDFGLVEPPPLPMQDLPLVQVIDDDPGYQLSGRWTHSTSRGYRRDYDYSRKGSGSDLATWTFAVNPGIYQISATWPASAIWATDAPFTVYDLDPVSETITALGTSRLNQRVAPDDLTDLQGCRWKWLDVGGNGGVFEVSGRMLVVELSDNADASVSADAIRIERLPDVAELCVVSEAIQVLSESTVDFVVTQPDAPVEQVWTVRNLGGDLLNLQQPTLSPMDRLDAYPTGLPNGTTEGFELLVPESFKTVLAPGESTSFTARFRAASESSYFAMLWLANNDSDESPFKSTLYGHVVGQPAS